MNCDNLTEIMEICGNSSCDCNPGTWSFLPRFIVGLFIALIVYLTLRVILWSDSRCQ